VSNTYRIVRFRFGGTDETVLRGLSLADARQHCADPQTSGSTADLRTKNGGCACHGLQPDRFVSGAIGRMWFDGLAEET
jgi:hypothetical protein